jgi:hypothetical protein
MISPKHPQIPKLTCGFKYSVKNPALVEPMIPPTLSHIQEKLFKSYDPLFGSLLDCITIRASIIESLKDTLMANNVRKRVMIYLL